MALHQSHMHIWGGAGGDVAHLSGRIPEGYGVETRTCKRSDCIVHVIIKDLLVKPFLLLSATAGLLGWFCSAEAEEKKIGSQ